MTLQRFQHFIGGEFCDAAEHFESVDPSTEQPWATMPAASAEVLTGPCRPPIARCWRRNGPT